MRDFFIEWSERFISLFIILSGIGVLVGGIGVMVSGLPGAFLQGLVVLVMGSAYVILMGGMLYLFFGIYHNTYETKRLLEDLRRQNGSAL